MKQGKKVIDGFRRFQRVTMNRIGENVVMEDDSLAFWRIRILFGVLFWGFVLSTLAMITAIPLLVRASEWGLIIFECIAWMVTVFLLTTRRLPYKIRASLVLLLFYMVGVAVISTIGIISGGPIWLFTFAVMVRFLLGARAGICALGINAGTLAGGVAHDLNNILSGIVSYPDLLLMDIAEESPLRKPILIMQNSGKKAAAIVQDLLTLARQGVVIEEVVNHNDIVTEYLKSPEWKKVKSYHPRVRIETDLDAGLERHRAGTKDKALFGMTCHSLLNGSLFDFGAVPGPPEAGKPPKR